MGSGMDLEEGGNDIPFEIDSNPPKKGSQKPDKPEVAQKVLEAFLLSQKILYSRILSQLSVTQDRAKEFFQLSSS